MKHTVTGYAEGKVVYELETDGHIPAINDHVQNQHGKTYAVVTRLWRRRGVVTLGLVESEALRMEF